MSRELKRNSRPAAVDREARGELFQSNRQIDENYIKKRMYFRVFINGISAGARV